MRYRSGVSSSSTEGTGAPRAPAAAGWVLSSAAAALGWTALVAAGPADFFLVASPGAALWLALSARAAGPGLLARLRPDPGGLLLGLASALVLYAGARAFLWVLCGGLSDVLCAPMAETYARFRTRALPPGLALGLLIAPAEELFWRGLVQARLLPRLGAVRAVGATALCASLLALASGEPFLALATLPTHIAWGALAARRGSLAPSLVSHALWSVLIAAVAPPM